MLRSVFVPLALFTYAVADSVSSQGCKPTAGKRSEWRNTCKPQEGERPSISGMTLFTSRVLLLALVCATSRYTTGVNICPSRETTRPAGEITSPNFPNEYPNNVDCRLTITADPGEVIVIKFNQFNLEEDEDDPTRCNYDSLLIIEDGKEKKRLCGFRRIIKDYTSTGSSVSLRFTSSSNHQEGGFHLTYSTGIRVEGNSICPSLKITAKDKLSGSVHSPNFPNPYPSDKNCVALIDVPDNHLTNVWFTKFALQQSSTCRFDKLEVRDWVGSGATMCGKDGDKVPPPMLMKGKQIHIEFTSDSKTQEGGFMLHYNFTRIEKGRCICTSGLFYVRIKSYKNKINRKTDDIQFEFKTKQLRGMIMYTTGFHSDYVHVGFREGNVLFYHVDLGSGVGKAEATGITFNDDQWHKVHIQRTDQQLIISFDEKVVAQGRTRGRFNRLDIPLSEAYFLGAPSQKKFLPNFTGCVRNLSVDGLEPIANAVVGKADYHGFHQDIYREC